MASLSLAVNTQQAEGERAQAEYGTARSQLRALGGEVRRCGPLRPRSAVRDPPAAQLPFSALLEDALRHEAVLAAFRGGGDGGDVRGRPGTLPLRHEQIRATLMDAASGAAGAGFLGLGCTGRQGDCLNSPRGPAGKITLGAQRGRPSRGGGWAGPGWAGAEPSA